MKTNGGYVILDLQDTNVYAQAQNCLLVNKPVMVYDNNQVYYADTIILDGTNIVLTKGGKTITIANDNTITTSGDIQNHLYENHCIFSFTDVSNDDIYVSFVFNSKEKLSIENLNEFISYFKTYDKVIFIGYAEYNSEKYSEISFIINDNVISEILFNNNDTSCGIITSLNNITIDDIQLF